jgi:hypothetical protein
LTPHLSPLPLGKGGRRKAVHCGPESNRRCPPEPRNSERVPTFMSVSEPFIRRPVARKSSASVSPARNCGASRRHALL